MSTLGTFKFWADWDSEEIGDIGHIQLSALWDFEPFGTFMSTLGTFKFRSVWVFEDIRDIGHIQL